MSGGIAGTFREEGRCPELLGAGTGPQVPKICWPVWGDGVLWKVGSSVWVGLYMGPPIYGSRDRHAVCAEGP